MIKPYGYIYIIRNKVNNKVYVGQTTKSFKERYSGGVGFKTQNEHLKNSISKYGIECFNIIEEFDVAYSQEELDKLEDLYIKTYDSTNPEYGFNKRFGGLKGKLSYISRQKISNSLKGENNPNYGKKASDYTRMLISHNHADYSGDNNPRARKVVCLNDNSVFSTAKEAGLAAGIDSSSIIKCCKGKQASAGKCSQTGNKLMWAYHNEWIKNALLTQNSISAKI